MFNLIKNCWSDDALGMRFSFVIFGTFVGSSALVVAICLYFKLEEFRDRKKKFFVF